MKLIEDIFSFLQFGITVDMILAGKRFLTEISNNEQKPMPESPASFCNDLEICLKKYAQKKNNVVLFGSAGADSAILAMALKRTGIPFKVITVSFRDIDSLFDESKEANRLYQYLGVEHQLVRMTPADMTIIDDRPYCRFYNPFDFMFQIMGGEDKAILGYASPILFNNGPLKDYKGDDPRNKLLKIRTNLDATEFFDVSFDNHAIRNQIFSALGNNLNNNYLEYILYEWPDFLADLMWCGSFYGKQISLPFLDLHVAYKGGRSFLGRDAILAEYGIPKRLIIPKKHGLIPPVEMWMKKEMMSFFDSSFKTISLDVVNMKAVRAYWEQFKRLEQFSGTWIAYCPIWALYQVITKESKDIS